jgi:hypothetical protein
MTANNMLILKNPMLSVYDNNAIILLKSSSLANGRTSLPEPLLVQDTFTLVPNLLESLFCAEI